MQNRIRLLWFGFVDGAFAFLTRATGYDDDIFSLDIRRRVLLGKIGECSAIDSFVEFRKFCADGCGASSAERLGGSGECLANAIGRFVEHQRVRREAFIGKEAVKGTGFARRKAEKGPRGGRKTGKNECGQDGGCARQARYGEVLAGDGTDEAETGVANAGITGIGAKRDIATGAQFFEDLFAGELFIAFAIGNHPFRARNFEVGQKLPRMASVFAGDDGYGAKNFQSTGREIA